MNRVINILGYTILVMSRYWRSTISLIIVYAFIVFAFASVLMFIQSLSVETRNVLKSVPTIWAQRILGGRLVPIEDSLVRNIESIRGVKDVYRRVWGYYFDTWTGGVFTIIGADSIPEGVSLIDGRQLNASDTGGVVICGTGYAEVHQVTVGSHIILRDVEQNLRTFKIVGIFRAESDLLTRDLLILTTKDARQILGIPDGFSTDIAIDVANPNEIETIAKKINKRLKNTRVVLRSELLSTYEALFGYRGSLFVFGLLMSLLAFIILAWQKASGLTYGEIKEIGIQKAVGWSISDILVQKFWEGTIISVNATLIGLIASYIHVFFFDAPLLKPFLVGWSILYPSFHLTPHVEISTIILVFFLSVIPYLAATIVPSWRAAISDPAEVMHAA